MILTRDSCQTMRAQGGEVPNLGAAGANYNLLIGRTGSATSGEQYNFANIIKTVKAPSFQAAPAIANKAPDPSDTTPVVFYATSGDSVDISNEGFTGSITAPPSSPAWSVDKTTKAHNDGTTRNVHIVQLAAPSPLSTEYRSYTTFEDAAVLMRLSPGAMHTWTGGQTPVIYGAPAKGTLHVQPTSDARVYTTPITGTGEVAVEAASYLVLYTPPPNEFGARNSGYRHQPEANRIGLCPCMIRHCDFN